MGIVIELMTFIEANVPFQILVSGDKIILKKSSVIATMMYDDECDYFKS